MFRHLIPRRCYSKNRLIISAYLGIKYNPVRKSGVWVYDIHDHELDGYDEFRYPGSDDFYGSFRSTEGCSQDMISRDAIESVINQLYYIDNANITLFTNIHVFSKTYLNINWKCINLNFSKRNSSLDVLRPNENNKSWMEVMKHLNSF